ncbi:hypothetical protein Glove_88g133 [Diversispora epigaea]|uniref:Uncharacterized protein n=1 Tax=Diversispora epigaea TaxID=1348612 RepID=A0A397J5V9_9GLOM|nr:hypothetical protein Glove_88g133 [Diversispora epigaea]
MNILILNNHFHPEQILFDENFIYDIANDDEIGGTIKINSIDDNDENLIYYSSGRTSRGGSSSSRFRDGSEMVTLSSCGGSGNDDDSEGNGSDGDNNNNNSGSKNEIFQRRNIWMGKCNG